MAMGGFPKKEPTAPAATTPITASAPAVAIPVDEAEFDEEGRLLLKAPIPPPRPVPIILHPQRPATLPLPPKPVAQMPKVHRPLPKFDPPLRDRGDLPVRRIPTRRPGASRRRSR
jgi:hypothetical protein